MSRWAGQRVAFEQRIGVGPLYRVDSDWAIAELEGDVNAYARICRLFLRQTDQACARLRDRRTLDQRVMHEILREMSTSAYIVGAREASAHFRQMQIECHQRIQAHADTAGVPSSYADGLAEYIAALRCHLINEMTCLPRQYDRTWGLLP